jgi:hypothetical protein
MTTKRHYVLFHNQNKRPAELLYALTSNLADRLSNAPQQMKIYQTERLELGHFRRALSGMLNDRFCHNWTRLCPGEQMVILQGPHPVSDMLETTLRRFTCRCGTNF